MKTTMCLCFFLAVSLMSGQEPSRLCGTMVGLYPLEFRYERPASQSARVEIWQCPERGETLQIAAWSSRASEPNLVIDTSDFTVTASAFRSNVVVIETTGGSRELVFVVVYEKGKPRLALKRATKDDAIVTISGNILHLVIPGVYYPGDSPPPPEKHDFKLTYEDVSKP